MNVKDRNSGNNGRERRLVQRLARGLLLSVATICLVGQISEKRALAQTRLRVAATAPTSGAGATRTQLGDGRWLLIGGTVDGVASAQIDITRQAASATATDIFPQQMIIAREGHTATVMPDGRVLVLGGQGSDGMIVSQAEIIDPVARTVELYQTPDLISRYQHKTVLLTDGRLLVSGGRDDTGKALDTGQLLDLKAGTANTIFMLNARYGQDATLLSTGDVLVHGGQSKPGYAVQADEIFNLSTGSFEPATGPAKVSSTGQFENGEAPAVAGSLPAVDAVDVPIEGPIAFRFNTALPVTELNSSTVTVVGPSGAVNGRVIAAEGGRLAFFNPAADLAPGTTYTAFLSQIRDASGTQLPLTAIRFSTLQIKADTSTEPAHVSGASNASAAARKSAPAAQSANATSTTSASPAAANLTTKSAVPAQAPSEEDGVEDWIPGEKNRHGQWRVLGLATDPVMNALPRLTAQISPSSRTSPGGRTAVAGQVLRYNGRPIVGAVISMGGHSTTTDATGHFLLAGVSAGTNDLKVDGTGVLVNGRHYTKHFIQVKVTGGATTTLPDAIFLPRVDPATEVSISSPADHELVLTHPAIPGLEVHVPKGVVLREYDGKIVTKLSITPIPIDRPPYPTPTPFSVYFTLQPGGAYVDGDPKKSIKVIYPNYQGLPAGSRVDFWNYDPSVGWKVYGQGVVSKDGRKVVPDANVGFRQVMSFGFGIGTSNTPPATAPPPKGCQTNDDPGTRADPVDCATGLFLHEATDLTIQDSIPISVSRTYRQNDPVSHAFGIGTSFSYALYLYTSSTASVPPEVDLVLADGGRVHYTLVSGSTPADGIWKNTDSPSAFAGSSLQQDAVNHGWMITMGDQTVLRFAPHSPNALSSITDRNGNTVTITLSAPTTGGNVTQVTSPNGRYIQFTYDSSGRITQATDNAGRTVGYTYDALGRLQTVTDPNNQTESYAYDSSHRMLTVTDRRNNLKVTNHYDANGRVSQQDLPDGSWFFTYVQDANGNVTQTTVTDPRGTVEQDSFNAAGYMTQKILAMGKPEQQTFTYQRDATNLLQMLTDPLGRQTKYTYDAFGDVLTVTRLFGTANAVTTTMTYDPTFHQLATVTDPLSHTYSLAYDTHGNLKTVTDPLNHVITATVNSQGLPTLIQDALSHQTQIGYLQADLSSVTDALGRTTNVFTDGLGRVQTVSDPLGNTTQYTYDPLGHLTQRLDAAAGTTTTTYDGNGNVLTVTDPRNLGSHAYTYDARNRLHTYTGPVGGTATYNYDGMSNLINKTDRKSQLTQYAYDGLNRLHVITYADGSTLTITWDAGNRPTDFVDSINGTIHRDYDGLDRMSIERGPQGEVDYFYDAAGRRDHITVAGQSQPITYQFDNANRLTQIAQGSATLGFGYDAANRRTTITLPNGVVGTFGFDSANQLTSISYDGTAHVADATYAYDAAGRRISASGSLIRPLIDSTLAGTTYDAGNHLTALSAGTLSYDGNGNLTAAAGPASNTFTWNARNQLTSTGSGTTLSYDALGRLVSRTNGGATSNYLYDGLDAIVANGAVMLRGGALDDAHAQISSTGTLSYLTDALGSVTMLTSANQAVSSANSFGAYGASATASGNPAPFAYAGAEFNSTDQLVYLRNRFYSPQLQRFISEDPIGLAGGVNTYAYVRGNPISRRDPLGLCPPDAIPGVPDRTQPYITNGPYIGSDGDQWYTFTATDGYGFGDSTKYDGTDPSNAFTAPANTISADGTGRQISISSSGKVVAGGPPGVDVNSTRQVSAPPPPAASADPNSGGAVDIPETIDIPF
jgi:RHS repeat-associated protein